MRRLLLGILAGAIALVAATPSFAQNNANQNQASLRLVIVDDTGAGIPMADITITPKAAGAKPVTYKSDDKGLAISPGLTPGDVVVHVEFPGFIPFEAPLNLKRGAQNQVVTLHATQVQVAYSRNPVGKRLEIELPFHGDRAGFDGVINRHRATHGQSGGARF